LPWIKGAKIRMDMLITVTLVKEFAVMGPEKICRRVVTKANLCTKSLHKGAAESMSKVIR
jgi:hypothetical protein